MPMNRMFWSPGLASVRSRLGIVLLATSTIALASACHDEPSGTQENRSSQVPAKNSAATTPSAKAVESAKPEAKIAPSATASAIPLPSPSARASVEAPVAPPDPTLDCDTLIEPADVAAACGQLVEPSKDQPTDDIGAERTCSRRWESKEAGALSLLVVRHGSDGEAKERYKDIEGNATEVKSISGIGDFARSYMKKGLTGHPIYQVEAVKGRFNVVVFNPKVTIGQTTVGPVCDENGLKELMTRLMKRIH